nr:hypothetical protein [Comamonas testosteroni]
MVVVSPTAETVTSGREPVPAGVSTTSVPWLTWPSSPLPRSSRATAAVVLRRPSTAGARRPCTSSGAANSCRPAWRASWASAWSSG